MTVFDALRYPISTPPSTAELRNLPTKLFIAWRDKTIWNYEENMKSVEDIGGWYESNKPSAVDLELDLPSVDLEELRLLRRMIMEWDT